MRKLFLTLCIALLGFVTYSQQLDSTWPGTNGPVLAIYKHPTNNTVYVGGNFTRLGMETPYLALFNKTTGVLSPLPFPGDNVSTAEPDGRGGYYIGGEFTLVDDKTHRYAAHIDSLGQLTAWDPAVDGEVTDIEVSGNIVYLSGKFKNAGGQGRRNIVAVDAITGALKSWYPGDVDGFIDHIKLSGTTIFASGQFTTVGATSRDKLAQIDLSTGNLTPFSITLTGAIEDMEAYNDTLYLGGVIDSINGQARQNIVALTIPTASLMPLAPSMQGHATDIELDGNTLFVVGYFISFGGQPRDGAASINVNNGIVTGWAPLTANLSPRRLTIDGSKVYLGCDQSIAVYDKNTAALSGSVIPVDGLVNSIYTRNSDVFIAGGFRSFDYKERMGIAAIDVTTHKILDWNPNIQSGIVRAIAGSGNSLYIGGNFDYINNQLCYSLAEVDAVNATVGSFRPAMSWSSPRTSFAINTFAIDSNILYVGGCFDHVDGFLRSHVVAFDRTTGKITNWDPNPSGPVQIMRLHNGNVYMGGGFSSVGPYMRNGIAAVSSAGAILPWNPGTQVYLASVNDIKIIGNSVYLAGGFDSIGGQFQRQLAEVGLSTGLCNTSFSPRIRTIGAANAVEVIRDSVYVGGLFVLDTPVFVSVLGAVNTKDGLGTSWNPNVWASGLGVTVLSTDTNNLYVGGEFYRVNGKPRNNFAVYKLPPGPNPSAGITNTNMEPETFTIWPNPAIQGKFNCQFMSTRQQPLTLTVTDITGRTLYTQIVVAKSGTNDMSVTLDNTGKQLLMISLKGEGVQYVTQKLIME